LKTAPCNFRNQVSMLRCQKYLNKFPMDDRLKFIEN
jgi:hypothetical protein